MKKTLFVAVLALAIVAIASAAFANGYETWNTQISGNATALSTPHRDYRLNTVKCAVCHAAHKASANGEVLLQSKIADACTYCHIDTFVGSKKIYDGVASTYAVANDYGHNAVYGYSCSSCHSVHGAGTYYFSNTDGNVAWAASVNSKILRQYPVGDDHEAFGGAAVPAGYGESNAFTRDMAVTNFCTQCHDSMFAQNSQTAKDFSHTATPDMGYTHPMVRDSSLSAFNPTFNLAGSTVAYNGQVAWKNSEACRSCHDAGVVDQGAGLIVNSFPHYTGAAESFLKGGLSADGPLSDAMDSDFDGVCLKCHVAGASQASAGVGINF